MIIFPRTYRQTTSSTGEEACQSRSPMYKIVSHTHYVTTGKQTIFKKTTPPSPSDTSKVSRPMNVTSEIPSCRICLDLYNIVKSSDKVSAFSELKRACCQQLFAPVLCFKEAPTVPQPPVYRYHPREGGRSSRLQEVGASAGDPDSFQGQLLHSAPCTGGLEKPDSWYRPGLVSTLALPQSHPEGVEAGPG